MEELTFVRPWVFILFGFMLIVVELLLGVATGFDLFLLGTCFLAGGGVGLFFNSAMVSFGVTGVLAISYVILFRRIVQGWIHPKLVPSNSDALIGKVGVLTKPSSSTETGQIKLENDLWLAKSDAPIEIGKKAKVLKIDGNTLWLKVELDQP